LKIKKIFLYNEPNVSQISLESLSIFLKEKFPVQVEIRGNIFGSAKLDTFIKLASIRIYDLKKPFERHNPTKEEISFEETNITESFDEYRTIMYDGFELQKILTELISKEEAKIEYLHVFFTNKLVCTFDDSDYRYHGRVLIGANPGIISITGIIEAPARSREYYFDLITNLLTNENIESIKQKHKGEFLEYNDPRLSKILEGYMMQEVFYCETGDSFCDNKECILFNAHWQKDLIYSQLKIGKLCNNHQIVLEKMTE
jgi:hypothetical protein